MKTCYQQVNFCFCYNSKNLQQGLPLSNYTETFKIIHNPILLHSKIEYRQKLGSIKKMEVFYEDCCSQRYMKKESLKDLRTWCLKQAKIILILGFILLFCCISRFRIVLKIDWEQLKFKTNNQLLKSYWFCIWTCHYK